MYKDKYPESELTEKIISAAIEVHSTLGPGLLEKLYEEALAYEFKLRQINYERQKEIVLTYKSKEIGLHRLDLVVENRVIVELKAVNELHPVYDAQILSYLHAANLHVGLILNFNTKRLKEGIKRFVI